MLNQTYPEETDVVMKPRRILTRLERIMEHYKCGSEDAQRFIDFRDEGHSVYEASVIAGLADPSDGVDF